MLVAFVYLFNKWVCGSVLTYFVFIFVAKFNGKSSKLIHFIKIIVIMIIIIIIITTSKKEYLEKHEKKNYKKESQKVFLFSYIYLSKWCVVTCFLIYYFSFYLFLFTFGLTVCVCVYVFECLCVRVCVCSLSNIIFHLVVYQTHNLNNY